MSWTSDRIERELEGTPLAAFANITLRQWDSSDHKLALHMPMRSELGGGAGPGHMHGGAIGALIDTAATFVVLASGHENTPTVNYRVDLLRPVVGSGLTAHAEARRIGRTIAVSDVDVFDDADRLVAVGRGTFLVSTSS